MNNLEAIINFDFPKHPLIGAILSSTNPEIKEIANIIRLQLAQKAAVQVKLKEEYKKRIEEKINALTTLQKSLLEKTLSNENS